MAFLDGAVDEEKLAKALADHLREILITTIHIRGTIGGVAVDVNLSLGDANAGNTAQPQP